MPEISPNIEESWKRALWNEFRSEYFAALKAFLMEEKKRYTVYPPGPLIFNAFNRTPINKVKAVILGQDPYHGKDQAHGLCFSVPKGIKPPPSLVNIFKEMHNDTGLPIPSHGNLETWANRGVMLLNATLTVRAASAGSHQGKGWEQFTDTVIRTISEQNKSVVFLLWGRFAQAKEPLIDRNKHLILKAAHPSPFSAQNGFFGCKHFSRTNKFLFENGMEEIEWNIEC
jgi:uracil-DNA glycosylase